MFVLGQLGKWILSLRSEILTARWQSDCSGLCGERRSGLLWAAAEERWAHLAGSKRGSESKQAEWEFPGGLLVSISGFHCHGLGSIPGRGTEIPQAEWLGKKKRVRKKKKGIGSTLRGLSRGVGKSKPWEGFGQYTQAWQYLRVGAEKQRPVLLCMWNVGWNTDLITNPNVYYFM